MNKPSVSPRTHIEDEKSLTKKKTLGGSQRQNPVPTKAKSDRERSKDDSIDISKNSTVTKKETPNSKSVGNKLKGAPTGMKDIENKIPESEWEGVETHNQTTTQNQ
jgi:hypothetical protein